MKNLRHMTSIHDASLELHKRLQGSSWYVRCQVVSRSEPKGAISTKQEIQEIIVFVNDLLAVDNSFKTFNSWPVRFVEAK